MNDITQLLQEANGADELSMNQLYAGVYDQLKLIARQKMASERPGHTLQATALVHEAYLKIANSDNVSWKNRAHFFGAAAESMRRILVDNARRKLKKNVGEET